MSFAALLTTSCLTARGKIGEVRKVVRGGGTPEREPVAVPLNSLGSK